MRNRFDLKYLERKKIEESLAHIVEVPLFIVVAAMGYGKTTIVRNFLEEREKKEKQNVIFLSFGEDEVDEVWIWQRLCNRFKEKGFLFYQKMEELGLPKNRQEKDVFIQMIREEIKNPFFLILDDYQECNSVYLNRLIEALAYEEISNLHIGIISRFYPEIPYDEMWMKGYCVLIEQQSFILSKEEVHEFFTLNDVWISKEEEQVLYNYTDGWMSAVYLALYDYKKNNRLQNMGNITHLMRTSIYDKLPKNLKELLMQVSLFNSFTAEQAAYITKLDFSLDSLCQWAKSIGFIKVDFVTGSFELHALLKAVATVELEQSGFDKQVLYERCGEWYERKKDYIQAIKYQQKANNIEQVFRIIEQNNCAVLYSKAPYILTQFFKEVSLEKKLEHIKVYLSYIYLLIIGEHSKEGKELFYEVKDYYKNIYLGEDKNEILGEIYSMEAFIQFNNLELMTQYMKKAYSLIGEQHSSIFGAQTIFTYGIPEILTLYHYKVGTLKETLALEKEYTYYYMKFINGVVGGLDQLFDAEYQYTTGNIKEAQKLALIACEKAKFRKKVCVVISSYFLLLRCDLFLGKKQEFETKMEELKEQIEGEGRPNIIMDYELASSYLYGCIRKYHKMAGWLQTFQLNECNRIVRSTRGGCVTYAILLIKNKKWIQLEALAEEMSVPYDTSKHIYAIISSWIFKAIATYHLYSVEESINYLKEGIKIAEPDGIVMPFVENYFELEPILQKLEEQTDYIKTLKKLIVSYKEGISVFVERTEKVILTEREKSFMKLLAKGLKNIEISKELNIALVTVEKTLSNIYRKLNVSNRITAISKFQELEKEL